MKALFTMLSIVLASQMAHAYPTHEFNCVIEQNGQVVQMMNLKIEDSAVSTSGLGRLTVTNVNHPANEGELVPQRDCGLLDGPCKAAVTPQYQTIQDAQVRPKITWGEGGGSSGRAIVSIDINMGRSGYAKAWITEGYKTQAGYARAIIQSEAMGFNYPRGIQASCSYYLVMGVRPGLSGSN